MDSVPDTILRQGQRQTLWPWIAYLPLAFFTIFQCHHALYDIPSGDRAWMATVAKNWAFGFGFSTSRYDLILFDPQISTGPVVLGWIAWAIRVLGHAIWVPGFSILLLNMLLLGLLLWRLKSWLEPAVFLRFVFLLPLAFSVFQPGCWIAPLGEVPLFLLLALAAVFTCEGLEEPIYRKLLLSGVLAGLAVLCKTIALIPVLGLLILPWLYGLVAPLRMRDAVCLSGVQMLGIATSLLPWWLYQKQVFSILPPETNWLRDAISTELFFSYGSGLGSLQQAWQRSDTLNHVFHMLRHNTVSYTETLSDIWLFGGMAFPLWLMAIVLVMVWALYRSAQTKYRQWLVFLFPAVAYLAWLLPIGYTNLRYAQPVIHLSLVGLLMALAYRPRISQALMMYLSLAALLFAGDFQIGRLYGFAAHPNPQAVDLQRVKTMLQTEYPDEPWVSCSGIASYEVDFVLDDVNRFNDCWHRLGEVLEFDADAFQQRYAIAPGVDPLAAFIDDQRQRSPQSWLAPVRWRRDLSFIVVDNPHSRAFPHWGFGLLYQRITAFCDEVLYDEDFYTLRRCTAENLRQAVDEAGGLWFVPPQWDAEFRLQRARAEGLLP